MTHVSISTAPTYADIRTVVRLLDGIPANRVRELMNAIFEHAGTGGDSIDWSDPDRWIPELLGSDLRDLAIRLWEESGKSINPRYLYGHHVVINRLKLLETIGGLLRLGERGRRFLAGDDAILRELVGLRTAQRRPSRATTPPAKE